MNAAISADVRDGKIVSDLLIHVDHEASVLEASKLMRKSGATTLLVTGEANGVLRPIGLVTANDIVTHVVAAVLNPSVLTTGDIARPGMTANCDSDRQHGIRDSDC